MALYLAKGSYTSAACTARISGRAIRPVEINTFVVAFEKSLAITGHLYASGPSALSSEMATLEAAMAIPNESVGITYNGTPTQHWLSTTGAIGNVVISDFAFEDTPLHMATEVKYSFTATAMYNNAAQLRTYLSLEETVSVTGEGGPEIVLAPQNGLPSIYQQVSDYTDVSVSQSGSMMTRTLAAIPPPVIWVPGARQVKQSKDTISYVMRGTSILFYKRDYSFSFILPTSPGTIVPNYLQ